MKSRDKTVVINGMKGDGEESVKRVGDMLKAAVES